MDSPKKKKVNVCTVSTESKPRNLLGFKKKKKTQREITSIRVREKNEEPVKEKKIPLESESAK